MKTALLIPLLMAFAAAALHAATLTVSSTADSGAGSLRAQIAAAATGDTVSIPAGTITLTTGEIAITGKSLTISGPGANVLTITTNATTRALKIVNAQCSISGITFNNCKGLPGDVDTGGAIAVDNFSSGGVSNVTTISDCAFTNNQSGWGGALDIFNGGLVMNRCTFSGNTCNGMAFGTTGGGGAVSIGASVASTITNCTFTANSQNGAATGQPGGGAIYNYGVTPASPPAVTLEHCTFVGNVDASGVAGAIKGNYTGSYHTYANLRNCLLANNQAPAAALKNFAGNATGLLTTTYASLGGNVTDEQSTSAQFMALNKDKMSVSTLSTTIAASLALNGGTTPTLAISRGSPAQRIGLTSTVATDQRGAPRHLHADAGAFELIEPELRVTVFSTALLDGASLSFGSTPVDTPVTKTLTITNTQTSPFTTGALTLSNVSSPAGFAISGFPSVSLANGQSASFSLTLNANNSGLVAESLTFTGNDAYNIILGTDGAGSPNLHTINLNGIVTDTADHWRRQIFGPGATNSGSAADTASPAGDGIPNLLKYSLGLDPNTRYAPGSVIASDLDLSGHLKMSISKNPLAADLTYAIEVSSDLVNWTTDGTTIDLNTSTAFQAHDNFALGSAPGRFIRLKVSRP
jgi:hypothetical protein